MIITNRILEDIRDALGLGRDVADFDTELLMHINTAVGTLNQIGVGRTIIVDALTTWMDFQDPFAVKGNDSFLMVPLFITLSTKQVFDPPPPSTVEIYSKNIDQILWRLQIAYESLVITD